MSLLQTTTAGVILSEHRVILSEHGVILSEHGVILSAAKDLCIFSGSATGTSRGALL
jgi:hypothetical protein